MRISTKTKVDFCSFYPFHFHCKVAEVLKTCSLWAAATEATRCPVEFWPTDNRPGLRMILVADSSLLSYCVLPPFPSLFMVGSAGPLLVRHKKVSVELLQEEKVVGVGGGGGGGGENGCFPWEPASAVGTLISSGESHLTDQPQTALSETFGQILLCKMQFFNCMLSLLWSCCVTCNP